ncbi:hypothetical protein BOX15_Mlig005407g1 [Macrostomum lignano]|uniref:RING-type E3 ubiquitin transferase n=1 Tax=Macrostomum lignano TaxID=282301 RepID=A0A267F1F6_9PLAT|nr:hypothetical protein BOX15_Mlig005407g1 [Macrostomum lignano]
MVKSRKRKQQTANSSSDLADSEQPAAKRLAKEQQQADSNNNEDSSNSSSNLPSNQTEAAAASGDIEDDTCPICVSILTKPVRLPCGHVLCLECLQTSTASWSALVCPMCRKRIGVWLRRRAKDPEALVDAKLWSAVQNRHPNYCRARLAGMSAHEAEASIAAAVGLRPSGVGDGAGSGDGNDIDENWEVELLPPPPAPPRQIAAPGELRTEWQAALDEHDRELLAERAAEEAASGALIRRLQSEERLAKRRTWLDDFLAKGGVASGNRAGNGADNQNLAFSQAGSLTGARNGTGSTNSSSGFNAGTGSVTGTGSINKTGSVTGAGSINKTELLSVTVSEDEPEDDRTLMENRAGSRSLIETGSFSANKLWPPQPRSSPQPQSRPKPQPALIRRKSSSDAPSSKRRSATTPTPGRSRQAVAATASSSQPKPASPFAIAAAVAAAKKAASEAAAATAFSEDLPMGADSDVSQEEADRRLALRLQRQFDLESGVSAGGRLAN